MFANDESMLANWAFERFKVFKLSKGFKLSNESRDAVMIRRKNFEFGQLRDDVDAGDAIVLDVEFPQTDELSKRGRHSVC
ncbi:hypothetical protein HG531_013430 [Fusarium graminearum]|nr:hypothetical protein HG531_013430 [Fusarium graminearum]